VLWICFKVLLPFFFVATSDGAVQTRLVPSICEDVFWRLRHLIYPSLSARAKLRVSRSADHFEADRQLPSGVHFAPNKEQNKRTDNRHDETGRVI